MFCKTFHIDSTEWTCRAEILARSATDATVLVDCRYLARTAVVLVQRYHSNGARWAVTLAVAAIYVIGDDHTILSNPYSVTDSD